MRCPEPVVPELVEGSKGRKVKGRGREPALDVTRGRESGGRRIDPGCRGDRPVAPTEEGRVQGGRLPAQVAVEGDLVCGAAGLRGAFALYAQVDPLAQFDAPAQADAVVLRPAHQHAAVGRQ